MQPLQPFAERVAGLGRPEWLRTRETLDTLQINITTACNLRCRHCHVQAGPGRSDRMAHATLEACLRLFAEGGFSVLDVTGGAPELNPEYRWLIEEATRIAHAAGPVDGAAAGGAGGGGAADSGPGAPNPTTANVPDSPTARKVITRTNLVILTEDGYGDLPAFWATRGVEVVGSLPSWEKRNTDRQRGEGVFERALVGLRLLNEAGYGTGRTNGAGQPLSLSIVVNPGGAFLPPSQQSAEREFRQKLEEQHGVRFDHLLTITNNPVGRFGALLKERDKYEPYLKRLSDSFNPATVENMMCRSQVSVSWDGRTFDCDFNQATDWPLEEQPTVFSLVEQGVRPRPLRLGDHCYACTAGAGSSCGGATAE
ncbi:MAG: radical SAM/Cys-rich domain protein [Coriobacteriales bacterium]|jgi:radical SAM/Cys-rich protein|nr:radical SAM/Cys-rich domain protein [Coriobacteriales bacterium]